MAKGGKKSQPSRGAAAVAAASPGRDGHAADRDRRKAERKASAKHHAIRDDDDEEHRFRQQLAVHSHPWGLGGDGLRQGC